MPDRPVALWKAMPVEKRIRAAEAFWRDTESPDIAMQQAEAAMLLARRLNFRLKSVQGLSIERRASQLGHVADVSDSIASRALIAYHFQSMRPLMAAFLDALGIAHDAGLISEENVEPPSRDKVAAAVKAIAPSFPADDIDLYLRTLTALDPETWGQLDGVSAHGT